MAGNTVTLTFAGDTTGAEQSFDRVGAAARDMGREVEGTGASFDRAGEAADNVDTKAMGFRDTLTGIQDGAEGIKLASSGEWGFETLLLLGFGLGDLASGMFNLIIPAFKSLTLALKGTRLAFLTLPITWIVLGIAALVAAVVWVATKTDWFQRAWRATWGAVKSVSGAAINWVRDKAGSFSDWIRKIPGRIKDSFSRLGDAISRPFKAGFNSVARAWNNTVGRLSWTVPGWVPGIGGNSISVPQLPTFHAGGVVPGYPGQAVPIMALAGERVTNPAGSTRGDGGWVAVRGDAVIDELTRMIARHVAGNGGGRAATLGIRFS
jgi:hypothetical protein